LKRLLALLVLVLLAIAGCRQTPATQTTPGGEPPPSETTTTSPDVTATPGLYTPAAFGDTVVFPSGVEVAVDVVSFVPAPEDIKVVGDGNQAVFSLTISNKSGGRIDASKLASPKVSYGSTVEFAKVITDAKITTLLDGGKETDQFSRFIPEADAHTVRVEVPAPDGGNPAIFEGSVQAK
jgi:hypothetical protein